jgi:16S rRNA (cytosine967-C5)-methyltransferase
VRVNTAKVARARAAETLLAEGIASAENPLCDTALTLTDVARRLRGSACFRDGWVELQDAASQAVAAALPAARLCLDYCAGGGGKALAMAAQPGRIVHAHDADPGRMKDLAVRAARAGADVFQLSPAQVEEKAPFDLVLCDAPCSGSGAWRRSPEAKWSFTGARLEELCRTQDAILDRAAGLVGPGGCLAYATCSLLRAENEDRISAFLDRNPGWTCRLQRRFDLGAAGDGFYTAHLTHGFG